MICKKDVIQWFKELESYKRIDAMCTLLNLCLPFELRFLGTCLEELGRRDSQELRGMELRVNNPQDLAADMVACQKGEPTDKKIRRKMALYLALIRACNRTCVTEIFRTLDGWGERDFCSMNDVDTLQELLLVYTMAANHPVFSFEQHMKCSEIFEKIKENKLVCDEPLPQQLSVDPAALASGQHHQMDLRQHHMAPSHPEYPQPHPLHAVHLAGQHQQLVAAASMQALSQAAMNMNFSQAHIPKLIPAEASIQHQVTVDGIPHMISSNIIPAENSSILTHPNAAWRTYPPPGVALEHPPQSTSPLLSQQSSPSNSRTTSPNRTTSVQQGMQTQPQQQQPPQSQQVRNMPQRIGATGSLKNVRRPSAETTPPPIVQQQGQHQQMMSSEMILPQSMKHLDDVITNNESSGNQLQNLIRNGFTRPGHHHRLKPGTYIPPHQPQSAVCQHFQAIPSGSFPGSATTLAYSMQNVTLLDGGGGGVTHANEGGIMGMNSSKSAGSDSSSPIGSSGEISPPETPTNPGSMRMGTDQTQQQKHVQQQLNYQKQVNLTRLNGRSDKLQQQQQPTSHLYSATDTILAPGGNAGGGNLMQTSLANNNSAAGSNIAVVNTSANAVSSNNNMGANTAHISTPSMGGGSGIIAMTTNSLILQPHQQQYNNTYSYHAAAAQHLQPAPRPPLMGHNPGMAPPPPGAFRMPGFPLQPNGEPIYPSYHPTAIPFLAGGGAPPGAPPVTLRSSNSASVSISGTTVVPQSQLQQQPPPQQAPSLQPVQTSVPSPVLLAAAPYSTLTVGNKPLSCYNCGSQTHSGRDCQEASMDDVTRNAMYKLDYSVSAASVSPTASSGSTASMGMGVIGDSGGGVSDALQSAHHQKQLSMDGGNAITASAISTSASTSLPSLPSTAQAAVGSAKNSK